MMARHKFSLLIEKSKKEACRFATNQVSPRNGAVSTLHYLPVCVPSKGPSRRTHVPSVASVVGRRRHNLRTHQTTLATPVILRLIGDRRYSCRS